MRRVALPPCPGRRLDGSTRPTWCTSGPGERRNLWRQNKSRGQTPRHVGEPSLPPLLTEGPLSTSLYTPTPRHRGPSGCERPRVRGSRAPGTSVTQVRVSRVMITSERPDNYDDKKPNHKSSLFTVT